MDVQYCLLSDLYLDPQKPRIGLEEFCLKDQQKILHWLWRNKSVNELVDSILANGYWEHEELFATEEEEHLVVVEGNRRLAATKIISDPDRRKTLGIQLHREPSRKVLDSIKKLPVILASREELWSFVGFKHVNGPQTWDSIAKAEYVYNLRRDYDLSLAEIASGIGDRHETVTRLYRGFVVLRQAQKELSFDISQAQQPRFPFPHLWTALGYVSVQDYLGVSLEALENENPVRRERLPKLENLMNWLFGNESQNIERKVRRQNPDLRHLARALETSKGIDSLESGSPLSTALNASLGDAYLFRNALVSADASAREAMQFVSTGFKGESDLVETVSSPYKKAKSLKDLMQTDES